MSKKQHNRRLVLEGMKLLSGLVRLAIKLYDFWNMTSNYPAYGFKMVVKI